MFSIKTEFPSRQRPVQTQEHNVRARVIQSLLLHYLSDFEQVFDRWVSRDVSLHLRIFFL